MVDLQLQKGVEERFADTDMTYRIRVRVNNPSRALTTIRDNSQTPLLDKLAIIRQIVSEIQYGDPHI
jgi:hypothetical protein